jgi:plasmid stabilization system protein ParE
VKASLRRRRKRSLVWARRALSDLDEIHEYIGRDEFGEMLKRRYRVVYRVGDAQVEVLTVFESHRAFPRGVVPDED